MFKTIMTDSEVNLRDKSYDLEQTIEDQKDDSADALDFEF